MRLIHQERKVLLLLIPKWAPSLLRVVWFSFYVSMSWGGMVIRGYLLFEARKQHRQFRWILPLIARIFKFTWLNSVIFSDFNEGRLLKLRHFLRIYDYFSAADWSWFSSGFPSFFDIICSQVLLYYFEIYLKKKVIQTKETPGTMQIKTC